jgi:hypothetical protein
MEYIPQDPGSAATPDDAAAALQAKGLARRRLLRAGASASPVLLTLASSPVSATTSCVVASSFASVATFKSRNPTTTSIKCTTRTCEDWYAQASLPATGTPSRPAYLDVTVDTLLGATTSPYRSWKCYEVLKNGGAGITTSGELGVLQHLISLCMNVTQGFAPSPGGINKTYLQGIWTNYKSNGNMYKLSAAGISWDSSQLITWLRVQMYPISI